MSLLKRVLRLSGLGGFEDEETEQETSNSIVTDARAAESQTFPNDGEEVDEKEPDGAEVWSEDEATQDVAPPTVSVTVKEAVERFESLTGKGQLTTAAQHFVSLAVKKSPKPGSIQSSAQGTHSKIVSVEAVPSGVETWSQEDGLVNILDATASSPLNSEETVTLADSSGALRTKQTNPTSSILGRATGTSSSPRRIAASRTTSVLVDITPKTLRRPLKHLAPSVQSAENPSLPSSPLTLPQSEPITEQSAEGRRPEVTPSKRTGDASSTASPVSPRQQRQTSGLGEGRYAEGAKSTYPNGKPGVYDKVVTRPYKKWQHTTPLPDKRRSLLSKQSSPGGMVMVEGIDLTQSQGDEPLLGEVAFINDGMDSSRNVSLNPTSPVLVAEEPEEQYTLEDFLSPGQDDYSGPVIEDFAVGAKYQVSYNPQWSKRRRDGGTETDRMKKIRQG
ncbi:uncharacterized protein SPPG_08272 [Spizellomyces punctatus DAOM BR117]|uniref:Uncharacterized protein n=1 Tax=Spizellomyces punctatus (strain DAOM BR117) TaxID=645134 RepID=A0A0L0H6L5_SPIPD|nr:uncharacterized protein SPPG_08272 [Spizellomyces punctatus DAOM BR117]KNC96373.1 hypothetical protein SPPG_08272 [Spizellomyces punctatus DAOM BR117]|eukprot:XP_016604413.1 hypothetical protein SPPG_08272 [Spizellomyces punctatus DAOM BR117]